MYICMYVCMYVCMLSYRVVPPSVGFISMSCAQVSSPRTRRASAMASTITSFTRTAWTKMLRLMLTLLTVSVLAHRSSAASAVQLSSKLSTALQWHAPVAVSMLALDQRRGRGDMSAGVRVHRGRHSLDVWLIAPQSAHWDSFVASAPPVERQLAAREWPPSDGASSALARFERLVLYPTTRLRPRCGPLHSAMRAARC